MPISKGNFAGTYDVVIHLKNGQIKHHKRVKIDNDQYNLGNYRLTELDGNVTLYMKSDIKRFSYQG